MVHREPNPEDLRKLHAEVNQITNQRFLVTTSALALFGVVGGWLIPRSQVEASGRVSDFTCLMCAALILFLLILFWYSQQLKRMLRVITTYLDVFGDSAWEQHWAAFRAKQRHFAYTKAQAIVFLVLGGLALVYPRALEAAFSLRLEPTPSYWALLSLGGLYLGIVVVWGIFSWFDNEKAARNAWGEIKAALEAGRTPTTSSAGSAEPAAVRSEPVVPGGTATAPGQ